MTRFEWTRSALALALAMGLSAVHPGLAQDREDLEIRGVSFQLSAADDEDFPGAVLVSFEVTGGDSLDEATGFLVEDIEADSSVFENGYLDVTEDDRVLVGAGAWSVTAAECGTTRNLRIVVISEEFGEDDQTAITHLKAATGSIEIPASYCTELGIDDKG